MDPQKSKISSMYNKKRELFLEKRNVLFCSYIPNPYENRYISFHFFVEPVDIQEPVRKIQMMENFKFWIINGSPFDWNTSFKLWNDTDHIIDKTITYNSSFHRNYPFWFHWWYNIGAFWRKKKKKNLNHLFKIFCITCITSFYMLYKIIVFICFSIIYFLKKILILSFILLYNKKNNILKIY